MAAQEPAPRGDARTVAFARQVAEVLEAEAKDLARAWLDGLRERLPLEPERIFPDNTLLNHVPLVIRQVAVCVVDGVSVLDDALVAEDLDRIAALRRTQGYSVAEVVAEFDLLADVIDARVLAVASGAGDCSAAGVVEVAQRVAGAMKTLVRRTTQHMQLLKTSEAQSRDEMLQGFGRAVSHELRNRLNACSLALRVLELDGADRPSIIERLRNSLAGVERVVGDVFAVSVMRGSDPEGTSRDTVANVVKDVVAVTRELALLRSVAVEVGEMPTFWLDSSRLRVVLVNLLSNALKYSDPDKGDRVVRVTATDEGERRWTIAVADNGLGIDPHELELVFEDGMRGANRGDQPGEGLGLALAFRAAEQLGGALRVESERGQGSTFSFSVFEPHRALEDDEAGGTT